MNNVKTKLVALGSTALVVSANATTQLSDITGAVSEVSGVWDTIKPIIIGVAVITVGLAYLKKLKRG